jgi:mono/diheme cytochrome c family protein
MGTTVILLISFPQTIKPKLMFTSARNAVIAAFIICLSTTILYSCAAGWEDKDKKNSDVAQSGVKTPAEMIDRGRYLVTIGGCNDCHSPKVMTAVGPVPDSTRLLSGHPANGPVPPVKAPQPGQWLLMAPDATAFAGPWGVSYAANLTSDSATGIGAWPEEVFIKTLRTGKHLGVGRPILPPMPWPGVSKMTDEDLKSVLAYFKSLPAINNRVPQPLAPNEIAKN